MSSLLAIEWLKIKRYRTFWVLAGLFLILLPLWNYEISEGMIKIGGNGKMGINILSQAYSFPDVWSNVSFWGSIFIMFLSILIIILTTNEFAFRTHRQNVIDGWTRVQFYHAKILLVFLLSILATVYVFFIGTAFGLLHSGTVSEMAGDLKRLMYFFLLSVDYLGFALIIGLWIRRSGLAIGLFLLYCLIIENILKSIVNWKFDTSYGNLLPLQASDELLPLPLFGMVKQMIHTIPVPDSTYIIATIAWCLLYYFIGRRMLLTTDW